MKLSFVQLLLVCCTLWAAYQAALRAIQSRWSAALSFGVIVLFCIIISTGDWFFLVLILVTLTGGIVAFVVCDDSTMKPVLPARLRRKECRWMILYETGSESLPRNQRRAAERFTQETTRFIQMAGGVLFGKDWGTRDIICSCVYRFSKQDGTMLAERSEEVRITSDFQEYAFEWGWGWPEPGHWKPGAYKSQVFIDGELRRTQSFTIDPLLPLTDILFQSTVRFYDSQAAYDASQDTVRFPQDTTREIICALRVHYLFHLLRDETYRLTTQCYTPEMNTLWEDRRDWLIKAEDEEPLISWRRQESGPWKAGVYRVEIQLNGEDFAWGAFLIE